MIKLWLSLRPVYTIQFWSQLLLKFKAVSDVNQNFSKLKQCQENNLDAENGSCEPTLRLIRELITAIIF